jgi:hypothetical protein
LKEIIKALPIHSISCFELMKGLCKKDHDNHAKNNRGLDHLIKEDCIGKLGRIYHIQRRLLERHNSLCATGY